MPLYYISWETELDAATPEAAGKMAKEILRDPKNIRTIWVEDVNGGPIHDVDVYNNE